MVESIAGESVELLLTEGTRISDPLGTSEEDVYVQAKKLVDGCTGLSVINFPPRDLARFLTFYRIAKATGRKFVIGFKQAYLLNEFNKICDDYPTIDDPNICLFADRKGWGTAGLSDLPSNIEGVCIPENICEQDYGTWEREFLLEENCVCYRDLKDHRKYMFYCNYFQLNELIDVKPVTGSIYLRSVTEPFDEEMELDAKRVDNWLDLFGLQQYGRKSDDMLHASGHASGQEICEMIQKIQPKKIITIHTEQPEYLKDSFNNVLTVKQGEKIEL
jgi:ribonuclease J